MQIEPYILLPIAASFVVVVILVIRLVAGPRNAVLSIETCSELLKFEEPDISIKHVLMSEDATSALVLTTDKNPLRLVRRHGDKLVLQTLDLTDINPFDKGTGRISIRRQDLSHPKINVKCSDNSAQKWMDIVGALPLGAGLA